MTRTKGMGMGRGKGRGKGRGRSRNLSGPGAGNFKNGRLRQPCFKVPNFWDNSNIYITNF